MSVKQQRAPLRTLHLIFVPVCQHWHCERVYPGLKALHRHTSKTPASTPFNALQPVLIVCTRDSQQIPTPQQV